MTMSTTTTTTTATSPGVPSRRRIADWFIRLGLWLQIVFLFFVDWGTISGFAGASEIPWGHVLGLILVNVVLLTAAVFALRWMRRAQRQDQRA